MTRGQAPAAPPRVSVVVPCFNASWSIERTLRSILAQRFTDFELVVVNDGSTDASMAVVDRFAADSRLRVVHQENRGLAAARNRGIRETKGEFVAPIDADDLWHPDFLRLLVDALDECPAAPFAFADSWRIDEHDLILPSLALTSATRHDFIGLLSCNSVGSGSAAVFRRARLPDQPYDEALSAAADWKLILGLAHEAKPELCPRKLAAYRVTGASMSRGNPEQQLASLLSVIHEISQNYDEVPGRWFRDARTMVTFWLLPAFVRQGRYRDALCHAARAYGGNPLFWRNGALLKSHIVHAQAVVSEIVRGRQAGLPLPDQAGFAYLRAAGEAPPRSGPPT